MSDQLGEPTIIYLLTSGVPDSKRSNSSNFANNLNNVCPGTCNLQPGGILVNDQVCCISTSKMLAFIESSKNAQPSEKVKDLFEIISIEMEELPTLRLCA